MVSKKPERMQRPGKSSQAEPETRKRTHPPDWSQTTDTRQKTQSLHSNAKLVMTKGRRKRRLA